jgi:SNF2 family DNA or RNA helicase
MSETILSSEQQEAVRWMAAREAGPTPGGGILADDVGKGKTFMAAGLIEKSQLWPTLVIVPKSTIWEWAGVLKRVTKTAVCVITSMSDDQLREVSRSRMVLATISCMSARTVPPVIADRIWGRVILDEAHVIRNPATLAHKALKALRAHAKWAMTATPVQNKPSELLVLARYVGFETDDAEAVRRELMMRRVNDELPTRLDVETVRAFFLFFLELSDHDYDRPKIAK